MAEMHGVLLFFEEFELLAQKLVAILHIGSHPVVDTRLELSVYSFKIRTFF